MDQEGPYRVLDHVSQLVAPARQPTDYGNRNGPSEFHVVGTLKDWNINDDAHKIIARTLLINGRYDEAQDSTVEPFFREIAKVKWVTFAESSHVPQWEERERFMEVVGNFLQAK